MQICNRRTMFAGIGIFGLGSLVLSGFGLKEAINVISESCQDADKQDDCNILLDVLRIGIMFALPLAVGLVSAWAAIAEERKRCLIRKTSHRSIFSSPSEAVISIQDSLSGSVEMRAGYGAVNQSML